MDRQSQWTEWTDGRSGQTVAVDRRSQWTEWTDGRSGRSGQTVAVDRRSQWTEWTDGRSGRSGQTVAVDRRSQWTEWTDGRSGQVDGVDRWTEWTGGRSGQTVAVDGVDRRSQWTDWTDAASKTSPVLPPVCPSLRPHASTCLVARPPVEDEGRWTQEETPGGRLSARSFIKLISGGLDVSAPTGCRRGLRDGHQTGTPNGSALGVDTPDRNRQARAPATLTERLDLMRRRFSSAQASSKEMDLKGAVRVV
ncbi:unnamed protein product [Boreogadus saida]